MVAEILTALMVVAAPPKAHVAGPYAFTNVTVIPMDRERVLAGQTVVVMGDQIIGLGPNGKVAIPSNAIRIDGTGKFLMPGLAEMHAHIPPGPTVADSTI